MAIGTSEKLAQESLCGNGDRLAVGKCVGSRVWKIAHDLERMRGTGGLLHCRKCRRNLRVCRFRLCEKPRRSILRDEKINFRLRLVPYVVEGVVAEAEVVPHVNGLEQMAGNEVFEPRTFIRHFAPVSLIPLRRFTYGVFDVPEPRADGEAFMEVFQSCDPRLYRLLCYADFAGEGGGHDLVPGAGEQQFGENPNSGNVGNLCKVAQIFPKEQFAPELAPAMGESNVSLDKRLWESTMRPESIPVFRLDGSRRMDFGRFKFGTDKFGDTERVHVVEEVPSHQAVAAAFVNVEPSTPGDDKPHAVFVEVEEPLEKRFPTDELVNLVKRDDGFAVGSDAETGGVGEPCRIARDKLPSCEIVPSEIPVRKRPCERSLSALARASEKRHLPVVLQMLFKDGFIDPLSLEWVFHGAYDIKFGSSRQYQTDRWVRMVITKLTDGSERYQISTTRKRLAPSIRLCNQPKGIRKTAESKRGGSLLICGLSKCFQRVRVEEEINQADVGKAVVIVCPGLEGVVRYHDLFEGISGMAKRKCFLFPLFGCRNGIGGLNVYLLWTTIDNKVDFVLPRLMDAVFALIKHHHAGIDRVSAPDKFTVDDIFHQMCRLGLAKVDTRISKPRVCGVVFDGIVEIMPPLDIISRGFEEQERIFEAGKIFDNGRPCRPCVDSFTLRRLSTLWIIPKTLKHAIASNQSDKHTFIFSAKSINMKTGFNPPLPRRISRGVALYRVVGESPHGLRSARTGRIRTFSAFQQPGSGLRPQSASAINPRA